jgi:hypothetical protein
VWTFLKCAQNYTFLNAQINPIQEKTIGSYLEHFPTFWRTIIGHCRNEPLKAERKVKEKY